MTEGGVFAMSEVPLSRHEAAERDDAAASSSASGACTPEHEAAVAPEADGEEGEGNEAPKNSAIELSRRAVPEVEQDPDVCSICLDEFTDDDPSNGTQCGHMYHLQCIMQWAQRSHECPMCFKALRLQEEALNELLPFGEYRPPEQSTPSHVLLGIEAWELDRLLARLAAHGGNGRHRNRATRHAARASRATAARAAVESGAAAVGSGGGDTGGASDDRRCGDGESGAAAATTPIAMQRDGGHGSGSGDDVSGETYPASWPPANHSRQYSRESEGHDGHPSSPAVDLRTRWAGISSRAKESLSKTTSELRSLWSRGSARSGHAHPGSGTAA